MQWKIEKRKLKDLKPHPKNPRQLSDHDAEHLKKSLEKFGLIDKPIITKEGMIIGGHQRIEVLKQMGKKDVECYVPEKELTEKDVDELLIRLNRNHGEWDYDKLANEFNEIELLDFGFEEKELFVDPIEEVEAKEEADEKAKKKCPHCGNDLS